NRHQRSESTSRQPGSFAPAPLKVQRSLLLALPLLSLGYPGWEHHRQQEHAPPCCRQGSPLQKLPVFFQIVLIPCRQGYPIWMKFTAVSTVLEDNLSMHNRSDSRQITKTYRMLKVYSIAIIVVKLHFWFPYGNICMVSHSNCTLDGRIKIHT
ncbi:hypothetical protein F2P56_017541, partial [Juglans regia]